METPHMKWWQWLVLIIAVVSLWKQFRGCKREREATADGVAGINPMWAKRVGAAAQAGALVGGGGNCGCGH